RCNPIPRTIGKRRFPKSRSKIRTDESADLYRRMRERDFFAPEKGVRHAPKASALGDGATESDAADAEARPDQFAEPGQTLRQTRDRFRALDRSAVERQPDGVGCRSCAERARRTDQGARCRARRGTQLCR